MTSLRILVLKRGGSTKLTTPSNFGWTFASNKVLKKNRCEAKEQILVKAFLFTILNPKICVSIVVKSVNILKTFFKFSKVWMSWKHFCEKHLCPKRARNCLLALGKVGKGAQTSNRGTGIGGIRFETDWFGYFSRLPGNMSFKHFLKFRQYFCDRLIILKAYLDF